MATLAVMDGAFAHSPFFPAYLAVAAIAAVVFITLGVRTESAPRARAYFAVAVSVWVAPIQFVNDQSHGFVPATGALLGAPFSPLWVTAAATGSLFTTWAVVWLALYSIRTKGRK
jgi:hypothetical protein